MDCTWIVSAPGAYSNAFGRMNLTIVSLDIEPNIGCSFDYVTVSGIGRVAGLAVGIRIVVSGLERLHILSRRSFAFQFGTYEFGELHARDTFTRTLYFLTFELFSKFSKKTFIISSRSLPPAPFGQIYDGVRSVPCLCSNR